MDAGVFLLQSDKTLVRMIERPYEAELLLQDLLASYPELLAGDQIDPTNPRRWLLIEREVGVPAAPNSADWWALDHLFLDQDAVPTFVEVKRASDTRARREVVAQMLDYAANATEYWPVDRMRELFAVRCQAQGLDPAEELHEVVGTETDEAAFWEQAKGNLREGRVRLLFVADRIPPSLRRIVEFLNRQMNPAEVLAVEIRQFAPSGEAALRTLVPRVIGQTEQARATKSAGRPANRPVPISREEFVGGLRDDRREAALAVLAAAAASGFATAAYRRLPEYASVPITLEGVDGTPVTLDQEFLWVSLGRYHAGLLDPALNSDLRGAILRVSPSTKQARDPKKREVGIRLESIDGGGREQLQELFRVLTQALRLS